MNIFERFIKQGEDEFTPLIDSLEPYIEEVDDEEEIIMDEEEEILATD